MSSYISPEDAVELERYTKLSRREQKEYNINKLEELVVEATESWSMAKFNRNDIAATELESQLIRLTTELNALKMSRPV